MSQQAGEMFTAQHVVEYKYRRSLGPVLSRFFTSLRDRKLEGVKTAGGRVLVPPAEYDPETGEATTDFVAVGPGGSVTSWTWVPEPRAQHPHRKPFAYALILLDGADTAMLHTVDVAGPDAMKVGMRVAPRWRAETEGSIHDIEAFVPEGGA